MPQVAAYSDDEMYNMWVACNKNASQAARRLGMPVPSFMHHLRNKKFHQRYAAEFTDAAEGIRRMVVVEALAELPDMIKMLVNMAKDENNSVKERIMAINAYLGFLPPPPQITNREPEYIDTTATMDLSTEDEVKRALENNVIAAVEARSRRKS